MQSNAQQADHAAQPGNRPAAKFKSGGIEVAIWSNPGENGLMYNTSNSNSYKDEKSADWKPACSYSPTDLLVVAELSRQAFGKITELA
jgi:hypothetical protein